MCAGANLGITKLFREHILRLDHQIEAHVINADACLTPSLMDPERPHLDAIPPTEVKFVAEALASTLDDELLHLAYLHIEKVDTVWLLI